VSGTATSAADLAALVFEPGLAALLKLICPSDDTLVSRDAPQNKGWDQARILLTDDDLEVEVVDSISLSEEERNEIYLSVLLARPTREVKGAFGSHGEYFGTAVPALIDYMHSGRIDEAHPKDLGGLGFWTIHDWSCNGYDHPYGSLRDEGVYDPM
jgi:hypothetical protein